MTFNLHTGAPSTLCPGCGHWNDWKRQRVTMPDGTIANNDEPGRMWRKPHQCSFCHRQIKEVVNPDRTHYDAAQRSGQKKLGETL